MQFVHAIYSINQNITIYSHSLVCSIFYIFLFQSYVTGMKEVFLQLVRYLTANEKAYIPLLGIFTAEKQSTNLESDKLDLPDFSITYTEKLFDSDRGFIKFYANNHNLSEEEASNRIEAGVKEFKLELTTHSQIDYDGLFLAKRANGKIEIEFKIHHSIDTFGFEAMELKKLNTPPTEKPRAQKEEPKQKPPKTKPPKKKPAKSESKSVKRFIPIMAAALVIIIVSVFIGKDFISNYGGEKTSETKIKTDKAAAQANRDLQEAPVDEQTSEIDSLEKTIDSHTDTKTALYYEEPKPVENKYYLIAGSFTRLENAQILNKNLKAKGFSSEIIHAPNNAFRVTFGVYDTRTEAIRELYRLRNEINDSSVWMLTAK